MKKRIGTKIYDTEKGTLIIPEKNLYKQPSKKTFYTFDGETIMPIDYDTAAEWILATEDPELISMLKNKASRKGMTTISIDPDHMTKLQDYSRKTGVSMKKIIEDYIDSLSMEWGVGVYYDKK